MTSPHGTAPDMKKGKDMDYNERLARLDRHLAEHPKDYQSVIARMKTYSDAVEHELYLKRVYRLKKLAEVRRQLREME